MFPKYADKIDAVQETEIFWKPMSRRSDQILVIEGWKLPTVSGAKRWCSRYLCRKLHIIKRRI